MNRDDLSDFLDPDGADTTAQLIDEITRLEQQYDTQSERINQLRLEVAHWREVSQRLRDQILMNQHGKIQNER